MGQTKRSSPYGAVKFVDIDQYHQAASEEARIMLDLMRALIRQAAPNSEECISYNMPAFRQKKVLVYYAAHKSHIGFYPTASPLIVFAPELGKYPTSKGAIQFSLGSKLPKTLITKIVRYRLQEVTAIETAKRTKQI